MNYKSLLYEIQNSVPTGPTPETIILPSNKQLYNVDLNTREIDGPETLSVQSDHYAETVYFLVDRYYDNMDLAQTNCVVQYTINGNSYVYAVPFCDTTTFEGKIIIPWTISASATQTAGTVKYFIRFYLIDKTSVINSNTQEYDPSGAEFSYSLSTLLSSSKVLKTLSTEDFIAEDKDYQIPERYFEFVNYLNTAIDNATIYWIETGNL